MTTSGAQVTVQNAPQGDAASNEGAKKLATVLSPILSENTKEVISAMSAQLLELQLLMKDMKTELENISKNMAGQKKKIEKKTPTAQQAGKATGDATTEQPVVSTYNHNKLVWFRNQYKANPQFREIFLVEEMENLMKNDDTITSRTPQTKLIAEATFIWNYIKDHDVDVKDKSMTLKAKCDALHAEAKAEHESKNKQAQLSAEQHTPPSEKD